MGFLLRLRQQFFPGMGMQAMKQEVGKLSDKDKADLHEWLNKEGMPTAPPTTAVATETEKA
jgi:cytochrome c553